MNSKKYAKSNSAHGLVNLLVLGLSAFLLSACQTGGGLIAASEYENFTPKTPENRLMNQITLRWEVRDDVALYCAQSVGLLRPQATATPPLACAVWQAKSKECVIVTGRQTSHVALGHEVRHCFEGHFHAKNGQP